MSIIKLLWCKVVGHKVTETHSKEYDGSMETYNICNRCGFETNHTTFYDCTDFTLDDLINTKLNKNKEDEQNNN